MLRTLLSALVAVFFQKGCERVRVRVEVGGGGVRLRVSVWGRGDATRSACLHWPAAKMG